MDRVYNFNYKGRIISYSESDFRIMEQEFKNSGRAAHRLFCSKVDVEIRREGRKNLEALAC